MPKSLRVIDDSLSFVSRKQNVVILPLIRALDEISLQRDSLRIKPEKMVKVNTAKTSQLHLKRIKKYLANPPPSFLVLTLTLNR